MKYGKSSNFLPREHLVKCFASCEYLKESNLNFEHEMKKKQYFMAKMRKESNHIRHNLCRESFERRKKCTNKGKISVSSNFFLPVFKQCCCMLLFITKHDDNVVTERGKNYYYDVC